MPPGRPPSVKEHEIVDAILKYREGVVVQDDENYSVVLEKNPIWSIVSEDLSNRVKPGTLYSYVVNDRFNLKNLLLGDCGNHSSDEDDKNLHDVESEVSDSYDANPVDVNNFIFILTIPKTKFTSLIMETIRQSKSDKGKKRKRIMNILKPQEWTKYLSKKIYDDFHLQHGYHFKSHHVTKDCQGGKMIGEAFIF